MNGLFGSLSCQSKACHAPTVIPPFIALLFGSLTGRFFQSLKPTISEQREDVVPRLAVHQRHRAEGLRRETRLHRGHVRSW